MKTKFIFEYRGKFVLNYFESDENKSEDHLRNMIEIFLMNTFSTKSYFKNNALRTLIKEILLNKGIFNNFNYQINNL